MVLKIIDIRIGRTDLTEQVSNNVYQRMISERDKEANLLRAEGQELSKEIVASADRQQTVIVAEAQRTSSILRGEGDAANKNKILGDAYSLDEDFFDFLRTMQACKETFGDTEMSMVIVPGQVCQKVLWRICIRRINAQVFTFWHWFSSYLIEGLIYFLFANNLKKFYKVLISI